MPKSAITSTATSPRLLAALIAAGFGSLPYILNKFVQSTGLTNVQQTPSSVRALQGQNFQQLLEVDYTADQQTNQGTAEMWGARVTLFNPATQSSGSLQLRAYSPAAFKGALRDAAIMMVSME